MNKLKRAEPPAPAPVQEPPVLLTDPDKELSGPPNLAMPDAPISVMMKPSILSLLAAIFVPKVG